MKQALLHIRNRYHRARDRRLLRQLRRSRTVAPAFRGDQALELVERQCAFGPRNPGSEGHRSCRAFLIATLQRFADRVEVHPFSYADRSRPGVVYEGANIVASFTPALRTGRIMLCAHWDTRPVADQDPDPSVRQLPIPGANDGASGVAVLLELARSLHTHPAPVGVDLVLFDLEDMGEAESVSDPAHRNPYCIGSTYFAQHMPIPRPRFGILLDMVGSPNLRLRPERLSHLHARDVVDYVWRTARERGLSIFEDGPGISVFDDHVPFLQRGIPVIDLIDQDYPQWHTHADTPDRCDAGTLQQIGEVLVAILFDPAVLEVAEKSSVAPDP